MSSDNVTCQDCGWTFSNQLSLEEHLCSFQPGVMPLNLGQPSRTFWMVYVEGGAAPIVKHQTHKKALTEANRLAIKTGKPAHVLRAEKRVTAKHVVTEESL